MVVTYDDPEGEGAADWTYKHGAPPWWLGWLMEEYYWLEKGFLPHGDRDAHDWEYLLALQTIESALATARETKQEKDKRQREEEARRRGGRGGGGGRQLANFSGPGGGR